MRHSLLIHLQPDKQVNWATFDTTGSVIDSATHVPLDSVPRQHRHPLVLIPGTDVLLTQANISSKQQQKIVQAVPYALEEQLAEDVENLHFALGKREPQSGNIPVAVIARTQMDAYIQQLNAVGITPAVLMPDMLAVPKPADGWGILYLNDIVLVRTGLHAGFAIESDCLGAALLDPPQHITVFSDMANRSRALSEAIPVTEKTHEQGILAWLAQGLIENQPLNLLQGDYRPQDKMASLLRPWRLTAALLLLGGGLHIAKQWIEYQQLSQQRQALNTQIEKLYRDTFPEARKIVNPRVQMEQRLKALSAQQGSSAQDDNFLSILNKISTPLSRTPGFNLKRIDYRQGHFDIQLEVANLQALENLKQRISHHGLTIEIQSAVSRNRLVESRLRIQSK
ncbi:MAG: type II secretion system protein GspL [Pseudomonadota bacterium]